MAYIAQQIFNILQLGSLYALIALGYTLVYGILSMINFAHGDLFMVGAFCCFACATLLGLPFVPTLLLTMIAVSLLAALIERLAYRPLRQAPRVSAIITALGVGILLESLTLIIYPYPKHIPALIPQTTWSVAGVTLSPIKVLIIVVAIVLMWGLDFFVRRTLTGTAMRAVSSQRDIVPLMGIPVNRIIAITFAIGGALGAAAGVMYGLAYPVIDPYMGIMVGWKAFISAVVGGIGNIRGAMLGAFILAGCEMTIVSFLPSTYRDFVAFTLLVIFLLFRPQGLLGKTAAQKV